MGIINYYSRIHQIDLGKLKNMTLDSAKQKIESNKVESIDLDKSWEAIHYIITGEKAFFSTNNFSQLISPKNSVFEITDEEYEFYYEKMSSTDELEQTKWDKIDNKIENQISYLTTENIIEVLNSILDSNFENKLDKLNLEELNQKEIYPENWQNNAENKTYIKANYVKLKSFLERAKNENNLVVVD